MTGRPCNIWLITPDQFDSFVCTGGKVIYIADEMPHAMHPAVVTASVLLPPMEAIEMELNNDYANAQFVYTNYLLNSEADKYISIILAAAFKGNPIGIMFGPDEANQKFPYVFMNFISTYYGLVIGGTPGTVQPYIATNFIPFDLAKLYCENIIDLPSFMELSPADFPIHEMAISKLAAEYNPPVPIKDFSHYAEYFNYLKNNIQNNNGRFLNDPMVGV